MKIKTELYHDNFQNFSLYGIPRAQLVICDIPYNIGKNAYGSSVEWYIDGDNSKGESDKAGKNFFNTDENFNLVEYFHFCSKLLKKEPKEKNDAPAMLMFCSFQQMAMLIETAKQYGFPNYYPIFFVKQTSPQVLKANMKILGAMEYGLVFYRNKLPKFRNNGKMVLNWFEYKHDGAAIPKIHATQKPVNLLKRLIEIFTDPGDVVIDPCAGSASTLRAAYELGRHSYGFEVFKDFYKDAKEQMLSNMNPTFDTLLQEKAMADRMQQYTLNGSIE